MISKARIKDIKALHLSKYRQIYNKFIAEGDKLCVELLKKRKYSIEQVFITNGNLERYLPFIEHENVAIISAKEMEQISYLKTPSDIFLLCDKKEEIINDQVKDKFSAIYLDGVQDPGNVGTIIRIADWFGINSVVRSEDTADFFHPKVIQATMGSMVNVALVSDTLQSIKTLGMPLYGTFLDGANFTTNEMPTSAVLVMGSEGRGISSHNENQIDFRISIPGYQHKVAESLNVAIATGIISAFWKK